MYGEKKLNMFFVHAVRMTFVWQENPFADRICVVFSSKPNTMSFNEFLSMLSIFSTSASRDIKSMYAFKIYGKRSPILTWT